MTSRSTALRSRSTAAQAFTCHGLGMPARNPETVRQRAIAAAR
jgi:hypothetical protein